MNKYAISIKWSDEDNGFIATIPGLHGLSAFGTTREKALSELNIAAEAYFESLKRAGRRFPAEEKVIPFSGQIRLRMPKTLHAALSSGAENEGVSLNTYIVTLLSGGRVERGLLKRIRAIEKMLEVTNSNVVSNAHDKSQTLHKIEEGIGKYQGKKIKNK
ncbi:MAG: type II toxin-antitoxin system HicB family antitoxin [Candidatus Aminicenantes bacterium]|nr:MAG: type II toxin-antitoxin system HicB family antitoxin [Candidatus Aminicenantes bacterium]